jgi:hypothetical protein
MARITPKMALRQTQDFFSQAVRFGITSVQNMSMSPGPERCELLYEKAPTPMRMRVIRMPETTPQGRDLVEGRTLPGNPTALITVRGTKWYSTVPLSRVQRPCENRTVTIAVIQAG